MILVASVAFVVCLSVLSVVLGVRELRRRAATADAALALLETELDRRRELIADTVRAATAADLDRETITQIVGARTWSLMLREENFGLPARAAAENALSVAVNDLVYAARFTPSLVGEWAFHGPAGELDTVEQRIAGAIKVYNTHARAVGRLAGGPLGTLTRVPVPQLFVEFAGTPGVPAVVS